MSNMYLGLQLSCNVQTMAFAEHSIPNNNGNVGTASPCGWPEKFSCYLHVFAVDVDLSDGGKLGEKASQLGSNILNDTYNVWVKCFWNDMFVAMVLVDY